MVTEILSGLVDLGQPVDGGPQLDLVPSRVAAEAVIAVTAEMHREDAASCVAATVDGTWAAQPWPHASRGRELQQVQYLLDADLATEAL
jgi:hypothetical protein